MPTISASPRPGSTLPPVPCHAGRSGRPGRARTGRDERGARPVDPDMCPAVWKGRTRARPVDPDMCPAVWKRQTRARPVDPDMCPPHRKGQTRGAPRWQRMTTKMGHTCGPFLIYYFIVNLSLSTLLYTQVLP